MKISGHLFIPCHPTIQYKSINTNAINTRSVRRPARKRIRLPLYSNYSCASGGFNTQNKRLTIRTFIESFHHYEELRGRKTTLVYFYETWILDEILFK